MFPVPMTPFQSAPAIAGERVVLLAGLIARRRMFQSAPAIAGERVLVDVGL